MDLLTYIRPHPTLGEPIPKVTTNSFYIVIVSDFREPSRIIV